MHVHSCPHCAQPFTLEPAYLAQYGGQTTICSRCNRPFTLPTAMSHAQPAYGGAPVLGYATPQFAGQQQPMIWREGNLLVVADQMHLPHACVRCGQPASGAPYRRTYYWHHPALYLLILPGLLIYAIVALCVRKKGTVHIWLCDRHRSARARNLLFAWLVFLSSIGFWVLAGNTRDPDTAGLLIAGGFIALLVGLIAIALASRLLYPKRIDRGYLWLGGAGQGFLRGL